MTDTLLATKIHIPPLRSNLVRRSHLVQRLNNGITQNQRLILISAPAGYGKSTLLREWVAKLDAPVAWLSLERAENNPVRFWSYFAAALSSLPQIHAAGIGEAFLQSLQSPQPKPMDVLLTDLVNDLSKLEVGVVLVLDDLHSISEGKIHQDLVFLIDHLNQSSRSLHLVVASRMDPPWPLARWRGRNELIEVRTKDLRFSPEETTVFFSNVMGLKLTTHDIALIDQRTEGWIAGLQLAALSMQNREDPASFLDGFSGTHRFILDYLLEEVLSQQLPEVQNFLLQTSLLDYLTAPLCDAITDRKDSQDMLLLLEKSNMFLVPMDEERRWYHYHHLFADLLIMRLKQSQPAQISELHRRASVWYAENNMLSEAIIQALDAGDFQRVNEFVSGNTMAIVDHIELRELLRHFEQLPDQQIAQNPWLGVAYSWIKAYADPAADMDRIFQQVEQAAIGVEKSLERQRIISHLNAIRAYVAWVKGDAKSALGYVNYSMENLPEDDQITRAQLLNIKGLALQYTQNFDAATQAFEAAIVAGQRTGGSHEIFTALINLAYINYLLGRLHQAFSLCQAALNFTDKSEQVFKRNPILSQAYATMSQVQVEWNDVQAALFSAQESVALAEQWKQADTLHYALTCLSKALYASGDLEEALTTTQRAMRLATSVSPWFFRLSALDEIWLNLMNGNIIEAERRLDEIKPFVTERDKIYKFLTIQASLFCAQGKYNNVLALLENPISEHKLLGLNRYLINLLSLQAIALQGLGREDEALAVIDDCLTLAEPEGYVRVFLEQGTTMLRLLQVASHRGIHTKYINMMLPAFKISDSLQRPSIHKSMLKDKSPALIEPLSERELQVLRLLNSSLTSTEIGQELFISKNVDFNYNIKSWGLNESIVLTKE
jgi:LuxR family maltose regulon positive regulatory protein